MYYGWIPTVAGHLSFSHIGGLPIRQRVVRESVYPVSRFRKGSDTVSILQVRDLADQPELGPLKFEAAAGLHYFLLQGRLTVSGARRTLSGVVISAPAELCEYIDATHSAAREGKLAIDSTLPARYTTLLDHLREKTAGGHYCLSFEIGDDGVVAMESLANASPTDENGSLLALEAYFFIKDVLHKHRFHNPSDDALLELTEATAVDDPEWYQSVIRNLHRSIISSFRSSSKVAHAKALGKLAYLESFLGVLERRNLEPEPFVSISTLRLALEQHQALVREQDSQRNLLASYFLWLLGVAIPIFFVSLQLLQIPCITGLNAGTECAEAFEIPSVVMTVTAFVLKQLDYLIVASVSGFALAIMALWSNRLYRHAETATAAPSTLGDLRDLFLRVSISHPRVARGLLLLLGGVLLAGAVLAIRLLLR